jgi:hypothetical protein
MRLRIRLRERKMLQLRPLPTLPTTCLSCSCFSLQELSDSFLRVRLAIETRHISGVTEPHNFDAAADPPPRKKNVAAPPPPHPPHHLPLLILLQPAGGLRQLPDCQPSYCGSGSEKEKCCGSFSTYRSLFLRGDIPTQQFSECFYAYSLTFFCCLVLGANVSLI